MIVWRWSWVVVCSGEGSQLSGNSDERNLAVMARAILVHPDTIKVMYFAWMINYGDRQNWCQLWTDSARWMGRTCVYIYRNCFVLMSDSIVTFVTAVSSQLIVMIVSFMKLQQAVSIYHDWTHITDQGSCRSLKVLEFFSRFSMPGKSTDMVLESPWICVWKSLKVLELDFLEHRDRTSDFYHQMRFLGSNAREMR